MAVNPTSWAHNGAGSVFILYAENITIVPGFEGKCYLNKIASEMPVTGVSVVSGSRLKLTYDPVGGNPTTFLNSGYFDTGVATVASGEKIAPFALIQPA